jgi:hypothetical protein
LVSEMNNYLEYSNLSTSVRHKYKDMLFKIDNRLWCHEDFTKMRIRSRALINERKALQEKCETIAIGKKKEAKALEAFRKKHNLDNWGGSHV